MCFKTLMEKVIVKIKINNRRRNSNWHDINKSLPVKTIGGLALAIIEAQLSPSICNLGLCTISF